MSITKLLSLTALALSLPPSYLTITSSRLLMNYEDMTKKAAKYTAEAERQLWKTRKTQGSAVVASLASLVCAVFVTFSDPPKMTLLGIGVVNALASYGAFQYVSSFWNGTARVPLPGSGKYNDAVRATESAMFWLQVVSGEYDEMRMTLTD